MIGLFVLSLVSPGWLIHSFSAEARERVKGFFGVSVRAVPVPPVDVPGPRAAEEALWEWVSRKTERNDLFFYDSMAFRTHTLRPITGSWKDSAIIITGTAPFYRLVLHLHAVDNCRAVQGAGCWFELARRSGARYVVIDPGVSRALPDERAVRVWFQSGWSLWKLGARTRPADTSGVLDRFAPADAASIPS